MRLEPDDSQQAVAAAVEKLCRERGAEACARGGPGFPRELWTGLAELGVLGLASPGGEGGPAELVAALEALGHAACPGPLAATFFATRVLPPREAAEVASGRAVVALGEPPLLPWAPCADLFLELDAGRVYRARPIGRVEPVDTLGCEPWGRVRLERGEALDGVESGLALFDLALAAQLAGAGRRLLEAAAEHARSRRQFGRAIGEFQAVAHPLADVAIRLEAATALARLAAESIETSDADARAAAGAARLSAGRAALEAAHTAHQVFGAVGITLEGPLFHVTRRIRQLVSLPPGEALAREALLAEIGLGAEERP